MTVFALDHGEATLIQAPEEKTLLIGAGGVGDGPALVKKLRRKGIKSIDHLVVQTWSDRHIGGGRELMRALPVKSIRYDPIFHTTPTTRAFFIDAQKIKDAVQSNFTPPAPGEAITLFLSPPCQLYMHGPTGPMLQQFSGDPNCSLTIQLNYGRQSVFGWGQYARKHQKALWSRAADDLRATVFILGRDGDAESITPAYLKPLQTRIAVLPRPRVAGKQPAPSTLAALKNAGIKLYRTDQQGDVTLILTGEEVQVKTGG